MLNMFANNDQSRAWFDHLETVPESLADKVQIPNEQTYRQWLEYVDIPAEDFAEVLSSTPRPDTNPELYRILQLGAASNIAKMGQIEGPPRFAPLANFSDPEHRFFYVHLLTSCLPFVQKYHSSLGIPDAVTREIMSDIGRNVRVHRKREGVGGLGVMWWLMLHVRGIIFQFGRLQFEQVHMGESVGDSVRTAGIPSEPTSNALSIHIPDFMGPMDDQACSQSIARAAVFFPKYFPNWPVQIALCDSWLLDPQLKGFLKPESNIIQFQNRFTLVDDNGYDASDSVMQFVFGKHLADVDSISPKSSLECGVINHLTSGGVFYGRRGWFPISSS